MRRTVGVLVGTIIVVLAFAASAFGAYSDPVIEKASLTVVKNGFRPTWKVSYLLCYDGSGSLQAQISEYRYAQGSKFKTLQVETRASASLRDPSDLGAGGTCAWYESRVYTSRFPQRAGSVTGVTLQVFAGGTPSTSQTRTFRLNP